MITLKPLKFFLQWVRQVSWTFPEFPSPKILK